MASPFAWGPFHEHWVEPLAPKPEDEVTPCRISGWMPWLPPTPKPTLGNLPVRDANRALITAEDREIAAQKGKGMQKPWREVMRLVQQHGRQLIYELDCKHIAVRWQPCTKTTCGTCPRELR